MIIAAVLAGGGAAFSSLRVGASARARSSQQASQQEPHPVTKGKDASAG